MKILITFYFLNNLGGIINNQEGLVAGLRELGHEVETKCLVWKDKVRVSSARRSLEQDVDATGMSFDQELGWSWPASARIPYKGKHNLRRWKEYASQFDLIIWQIPVPTKQAANRGNTDWLELYDVPVKQIIYTHDGNIKDYPWIYKIVDKLHGAVGVHPCAYHGLANVPLPRAMAFSAQQFMAERVAEANKNRSTKNGFLSLQTLKGWKHVDDLVRAVPHMQNDQPKLLAGGGIHWYYMTSKEKMRKEYICSKDRDPDAKKSWIGKAIWDIAMNAGLYYLGYITNSEREMHMRYSKFVVDPSWSKKYAQVGDHFNRTIVEGIINGCVPIARNFGVATNEEGLGEFFLPGENYVMIPWDATPKEFAEAVDSAANMSKKAREQMLESGRGMLHLWDSKFVAQTFVDLANGKPAGVYKRKNDRGKFSEEMEAKSNEVFDEFFAG